jgi:hypothetical protein
MFTDEQKKIILQITTIVERVRKNPLEPGYKVFYSPEEWAERGELYGKNSELIVMHDGGDHAAFFNLDYMKYDLHDMMQKELEKLGYYAEQCTSCYTAIYHI